MRLAWRVFLSTSLVMLVLIGISGWSLRAVNRFVRVNSVLVDRTVPALRLETSLREQIPRLIRLESRWALLRDPTYGALWIERAARVEHDLDVLAPYLTTPEEARHLRKSQVAFTTYRTRVQAAHAPARPGHRRPIPDARRDAERTHLLLELLTDATQANLARAQDETRSLELATRNALATALLLAIVAGLGGALLVAYGWPARSDASPRRPPRSRAARFSAARRARRRRHRAPHHRLQPHGAAAGRGRSDEGGVLRAHLARAADTAHRRARRRLLLRDEVPGPLAPKQARLVEIVRGSTERVLTLVNRILELSRLQAGLVPYERRWVDLEKVVARALDELRPQAEARSLVLERNGPRPAGGVQGDEERLLQVLVNLVGNAIKFTPPGGRVHVHADGQDDHVEITVEDTGVGIPRTRCRGSSTATGRPPRARRLGPRARDRKSIVEAHGGAVRAESSPGSAAASRSACRGATRRMKRTAGAVAALALLGACARLHPGPSVDTGTTADLARADDLARTGSGRAARTLYRKVLRGRAGRRRRPRRSTASDDSTSTRRAGSATTPPRTSPSAG
jgi:signal transduction histidine kinase